MTSTSSVWSGRLRASKITSLVVCKRRFNCASEETGNQCRQCLVRKAQRCGFNTLHRLRFSPRGLLQLRGWGVLSAQPLYRDPQFVSA
eukprot:1002806-Karenia_brevis.AAC.1